MSTTLILADYNVRINREKSATDRNFESVKSSEMVLSKLRQTERINEKERDKNRTEIRKLQEETKTKRNEINQVLTQSRKQKGRIVKNSWQKIFPKNAVFRRVQSSVENLTP